MENNFVTAINCMDGRVQKPVMDFAIAKFGADYVDIVTEAGPDNILSENKDIDTIESIKKRVLISVEKHESKVIIIAGHHDCAGNPVEKEMHYKHIRESVENIKKWNFDVEVCGVWVDESWGVQLI